MAKPEMILLDEPSMGLAPQIVEEIFEIVKDLNQSERVSFLLAEQNTMVALRYADFGCPRNGRVVMEGMPRNWHQRGRQGVLPRLVECGRKSFRDVKHYRRRKRWLFEVAVPSSCFVAAPLVCLQHTAQARASPVDATGNLRTRFGVVCLPDPQPQNLREFLPQAGRCFARGYAYGIF